MRLRQINHIEAELRNTSNITLRVRFFKMDAISITHLWLCLGIPEVLVLFLLLLKNTMTKLGVGIPGLCQLIILGSGPL